jgi:hypothetical protein
MRTLLAIVIILGGTIGPDATADAARKRSTRQQGHAAQPRANAKEQVECADARHEDPTGSFAGYPCWARESFARGSQGNRQ